MTQSVAEVLILAINALGAGILMLRGSRFRSLVV